jgi:hypothetical protein
MNPFRAAVIITVIIYLTILWDTEEINLFDYHASESFIECVYSDSDVFSEKKEEDTEPKELEDVNSDSEQLQNKKELEDSNCSCPKSP